MVIILVMGKVGVNLLYILRPLILLPLGMGMVMVMGMGGLIIVHS